MVGNLVVSFCERTIDKGFAFVDLWAYPDGTYNFVVASPEIDGRSEMSFPCSLSQLNGVLDRKRLEVDFDGAVLSVGRFDDRICAEIAVVAGSARARHCIEAAEFANAIEALSRTA